MIAEPAGDCPPLDMQVADDAGALLVRSGLVSTSAFEDARAQMEREGGTIGEHLVDLGTIGDDVLTEFYRSRLLVPQVNPNTLARLPIRVTAMLSRDLAVEHRAIPVALDAENNLTIAMSDPSDRHAVDEIAFFTGAYIVRAVATQLQIAWCLAHYYGHVTKLGQRLLQQRGDAEPTSSSSSASASDGVPDSVRPRSRSVSGEIRVTRQSPEPEAEVTPEAAAGSHTTDGRGGRAATVRQQETPYEDGPGGGVVARVPEVNVESGPVIVVEEMRPEEAATLLAVERPRARLRAVKEDPPELAARAGEVEIAAATERAVDEGPGIIVDDSLLLPAPRITVEETSGGVVIQESVAAESVPILLDAHARKQRAPRPSIPTQVGIGAVAAHTRSAPPGNDESRPTAQVRVPQVTDAEDDWGPPGTTIPPPLLGAMPGVADQPQSSSAIPIPNLDSGPLIVAPPMPPERARTASGGIPKPPPRALEDAMLRALELIRALETAAKRDQVLSLMIEHLAASHRRAGFYVARPTADRRVQELALFALEPRTSAALSEASLRLDRASTLQDVVDTRLPYRGPMHDLATRAFLESTLGTCPDEILLVPVAVRDRVVGILFGIDRFTHTFDEQLALASRAAGAALERILVTKRVGD